MPSSYTYPAYGQYQSEARERGLGNQAEFSAFDCKYPSVLDVFTGSIPQARRIAIEGRLEGRQSVNKVKQFFGTIYSYADQEVTLKELASTRSPIKQPGWVHFSDVQANRLPLTPHQRGGEAHLVYTQSLLIYFVDAGGRRDSSNPLLIDSNDVLSYRRRMRIASHSRKTANGTTYCCSANESEFPILVFCGPGGSFFPAYFCEDATPTKI